VSVDLNKRLEYALDVQQTNAHARVFDADSHDARVIVARDADAATLGSEFDRVGDEVEEYLLKSLGVCHG